MTATSTPSSPGAAGLTSAEIPAFSDLCRGEWTKIRTVRSTVWSLLAMAVLSVGFTAFYAWKLTSSWSTLGAAGRNGFTSDPVAVLLQPGSLFGQLAVGVLGVLLMSSEYSTGMMRASVLATPRRLPILAAKAVVFSAVVFLVAVAVAVAAFLVGSAITSQHASMSIGDAATLRAVLGFGVYMVLTAMIALAIGAIVGHPTAGIGTLVGLQYVAPLVSSFLPGSFAEHVYAALPATIAAAIMSNGHSMDNLYPPAASLAILVAWTVVLLAAGFVSVKRRDVS
jgi:ABC-2 type transport system permease protein